MLQEVGIFMQEYIQWFFVAAGVSGMIFLAVISRRLRKLNRGLSGMAGKMGAYFEAIELEEVEKVGMASEKPEVGSVNRKKEVQGEEDEIVLNSVINEFFS